MADAAGDGYSEDAGQLYHAILAARIGMLSQELEAALLQVCVCLLICLLVGCLYLFKCL